MRTKLITIFISCFCILIMATSYKEPNNNMKVYNNQYLKEIKVIEDNLSITEKNLDNIDNILSDPKNLKKIKRNIKNNEK